MEPTAKRRLVVIVGRPNVGKSTIFNRLVRRRIAIVHPESGVTRDRIMREAEWYGARFELADTGGLVHFGEERSGDVIEHGVRRQVDQALDEAAVALFVVDAQTGILPLDEDMARLLHRVDCPVIMAANKADNAALEQAALEFSRFGFPVHAVSATHARGFDALMADVLARLPEGGPGAGEPPLRIAVVGRPNVGKSSYINRLMRSERVIVSAVPGTTRDSIDIPFTVGEGEAARRYLLIDTAGLRQPRKVDSEVERFSIQRTEQSIMAADVVVLMFDTEDGPTAHDKHIAASILANNRGCVLVMNKWDKAPADEAKCAEAVYKTLPFLRFCPLVCLSAKTGYNVQRSLEVIEHVAAQVRTQLPTGLLNRTIMDAYERVAPPMEKGKRLKIFYAVQTGRAPIFIRLYVNDPKRAGDPYRDFLVNTLRRQFGLEGAPVRLLFTPRKQREGRVAPPSRR